MARFCVLLLCLVTVEWLAAPAVAGAQDDLTGCKLYDASARTSRIVSEKIDGKDEQHAILNGTAETPVQINCDTMQFFADHLENFRYSGRVTAEGNVLFVSEGTRISADRMEFSTITKTGTFYAAHGTTTLREKADPGLFGGQEPDVYFYGDELRKVGPKKYIIVRGGFTTCVQPTPRWEIVVRLDLDDAGRPRHPEERNPEGQGRAADVPPDLLLPDSGRRSRHGLPPAGVRQLDHPRPDDQQRLLLGHEPQPGPHAVSRLVLEDGSGLRRRVSLHARARFVGQLARVSGQRARIDLHDRRRVADDHPCEKEL